MHLIEVNIFAVASSKAHYLGLINRVDSVKPLCCVEILKLNFRLVPHLTLEVKSPEVFLIRIGLTSDSDHKVLLQTWSVIGASIGKRRSLFWANFFHIHDICKLFTAEGIVFRTDFASHPIFPHLSHFSHKSKLDDIIKPCFLCLPTTENIDSKF